ncbi:MAG: hypothetical protein IPO36_11195 [Anaerolineales bacterium]|nr:hypothetical protein [Anaerolineales bacterium]
MRPRIHEWTTLYSSIREIFVDGFSQTLTELREWLMSADGECAVGRVHADAGWAMDDPQDIAKCIGRN